MILLLPLLLVVLMFALPVAWEAQRVASGKGPARLPGFFGEMAERWGQWSRRIGEKAKSDRQKAAALRKERESLLSVGENHRRSNPPSDIEVNRSTKTEAPRSSRVAFRASGKPQASHGAWVRFVYVDEQGEVTDREIHDWVMTRIHLEGWCTLRREIRTFRIDRIERWQGWA